MEHQAVDESKVVEQPLSEHAGEFQSDARSHEEETEELKGMNRLKEIGISLVILVGKILRENGFNQHRPQLIYFYVNL